MQHVVISMWLNVSADKWTENTNLYRIMQVVVYVLLYIVCPCVDDCLAFALFTSVVWKNNWICVVCVWDQNLGLRFYKCLNTLVRVYIVMLRGILVVSIFINYTAWKFCSLITAAYRRIPINLIILENETGVFSLTCKYLLRYTVPRIWLNTHRFLSWKSCLSIYGLLQYTVTPVFILATHRDTSEGVGCLAMFFGRVYRIRQIFVRTSHYILF